MLSILIILISCNEKSTDAPEGPASISIRLMDDPGDYDNVFIDIVDVMVKYNTDSNDNSGWQSLEAINTGVYDLLELTGGVDVLLVDNYEIEAGTLQQIRLVLGDQNSIVIDGEEFPLNTPSAQQSGLKIQVNQDIDPNLNYTFLLDFVVEESIVIAGNSGNINLKPVLRASLEATSGFLTGTVLPLGVAVEVTADNGIDQASAFTDENGIFFISGLTAGIYTVTVTPDPASGLTELVIENVEIVTTETTDLGELLLE
ncbi:MAG: DUF4382 domain-containing protein [Flavobacteriaceae bacterium]|nr:DUF4382 domain-containing protein [Flavobacteriaceae bacterium]